MSNLGQHLKFSNGKTSPNRTDTGFYPVYGANGIIGYSSEYNSDENTIIIGRVGSYCGSVHFSDKKCWVTDNAISARSMNLKESIFWFYYLKSLNLNSMRVGSGQPLLNQTILKSISLPDLNINKIKVGEILLSFDQKIDLNTQINQTLEQIAQALFKSWFVDFDPVRAKVQALSDGLSLEQAELAAMQAISGKTPEELTALSQTQPDRYAELAETAKAFPCEMVEVDGVEVPKGWEIKPIELILDRLKNKQKLRKEEISFEGTIPVFEQGASILMGYHDKDAAFNASIDEPIFIFGDHTCITKLSPFLFQSIKMLSH